MVCERRDSSVVPIQEGCCNGLGVGGSPTSSVSVRSGAEVVVSSRSWSSSNQFKPLGKLVTTALGKLFPPKGDDAAATEYLQAMAKVDFLGYDGASHPRQRKFGDCDRETHAMLVDLERSRLAEFTVLGTHS